MTRPTLSFKAAAPSPKFDFKKIDLKKIDIKKVASGIDIQKVKTGDLSDVVSALKQAK